jgi:hypothetical protein
MPDDSSSNSSQSELLKQQKESLRKEIEREKMEKEEYRRENEAIKNRLSELTFEVNKIKKIKIVRF